MTRLIACSLTLIAVSPALTWGQNYTNPSAPSRYAQQPQRPAQVATPAGQPGAAYPVRPTAQQQPIGQPAAGGLPPNPAVAPAIAPAMPQQPTWVAQLNAAEQKWVDDVLQYWEARSDKIKLFECQFQRWDYDGGPVDAEGKRHSRTYAKGAIKYAQPDKGLYHVQELIATNAGAPGQPPQAVVQNPDLGEHWVCNGQEVYSFEASKKQVTVTPLPPEMRGRAIADGPLPFMFGAKAQTIKARYWVRRLEAAPDDKSKQGKYWLEAVPKGRQDAQSFKMVRIVLDEKDYLPESLEIFAPHYDPPRNDARQTYVFSDRKTQDEANLAELFKKGLDPLKLFNRDFYDVKIPLGWRKVVQGGVAAGPAPPAGPAPIRQAEQPTAPQRQSLPVPR
jgi:TIGR03009 family protein